MLKKIPYTFLFFLAFTFALSAQTNSELKIKKENVHQFIYELHGEDAKLYISNNPDKIEEMKVFLENNIYFRQYKSIPKSVTDKLSSYVPLKPSFVQNEFNSKTFNPFLYEFEKVESPKKIHIDGTKYVLFINPNLK